jgi:hypothetical protein
MSLVNAVAPLFAQAADPPLAHVPWGPTLGVAASAVVLCLLLGGLKNPQLWIIVSVLAISIGIGGAIYGLVLYNSPAESLPPQTVERASIAIGGGAGAAVGGFVLLLVAVLRMRMNAERRP